MSKKHGASILFLLIVLFLVYLSNSGKLTAIKQVFAEAPIPQDNGNKPVQPQPNGDIQIPGIGDVHILPQVQGTPGPSNYGLYGKIGK